MRGARLEIDGLVGVCGVVGHTGGVEGVKEPLGGFGLVVPEIGRVSELGQDHVLPVRKERQQACRRFHRG